MAGQEDFYVSDGRGEVPGIRSPAKTSLIDRQSPMTEFFGWFDYHRALEMRRRQAADNATNHDQVKLKEVAARDWPVHAQHLTAIFAEFGLQSRRALQRNVG
jgi:hypothetical protein